MKNNERGERLQLYKQESVRMLLSEIRYAIHGRSMRQIEVVLKGIDFNIA